MRIGLFLKISVLVILKMAALKTLNMCEMPEIVNMNAHKILIFQNIVWLRMLPVFPPG